MRIYEKNKEENINKKNLFRNCSIVNAWLKNA